MFRPIKVRKVKVIKMRVYGTARLGKNVRVSQRLPWWLLLFLPMYWLMKWTVIGTFYLMKWVCIGTWKICKWMGLYLYGVCVLGYKGVKKLFQTIKEKRGEQ